MKLECPLHKLAQVDPERVFIQSDNLSISYRNADRAASEIERQLSGLGLKPGQRAAVLARNSIDLCFFYLACLRCGISFVALNHHHGKDEIVAEIVFCRVSVLFVSPEFRDMAAGVAQPVFDLPNYAAEPVKLEPNLDCFWDDTLEGCVIFTSGSSGRYKGVVLPVAGLVAAAVASNRHTRLAPGDIWLLSLPLYHVAGLGILLRILLAGATVYVPKDLSRDFLFPLLQAGKITHISLVPSMLRELLELSPERDFGVGLKVVLLGGAELSTSLAQSAVRMGLPLMNSYGLTETCGHICCSEILTAISDQVSCGSALHGSSVEVISNQKDSSAMPGNVGQIRVNGPTLFSGYLGPAGFSARTGQGFLTQDLGVLNAKGALIFVGRADNVINSGGEKFSAADLEIAAKMFPGVAAAAVVPAPDLKWGERPILIIEPDEGRSISREDFSAHLQRVLPKLKWPKKVLLQKIPLNSLGKIDYETLRVEARDRV